MNRLKNFLPSLSTSDFNLQLKCLKNVALWKSSTIYWRLISTLLIFVQISVISFVVFHELAFIYENLKDVHAVCECITPLIAQFSGGVKAFILWKSCEKFHKLIKDIKELNDEWRFKKYSKMIDRVNKNDRIITRIMIANYFFAAISFIINPILKMIAERSADLPRSYDMPNKSSFFYDTHQSPAFELTYATFAFSLISAANMHSAADSIFLGCYLNIGCHFDVLRDIIHEVEMKEFVGYHQRVLKIATDFNEIYEGIIFLIHLLMGVIFCAIGFQIVNSDDSAVLTNAGVLAFSTTLQLFVFSYGGQLFMDKSAAVCDEVYEVDLNYLFIMCRSQRRMKIKAGFFHASLPTMTTILNSAGSMMALLKSIA